MKYGIALLALITLPNIALSSESKFGMGIGHTYGGLLGTQYSYINGNHKYRFHLGFISLGTGYEYQITPKTTLGASLGVQFPFGRMASLDWAYYFSGAQRKGFNIGLSAVFINSDSSPYQPSHSGGHISEDSDKSVLPWFSIGYQF